MKRLVSIVAALFLLTAGVWAQDSKGIYNKYSDNDQVSAVYISSAMFKLIGNLPSMDMGDESMDIGSIIKTLDSMYILECEDPEVSKNIKEDVSKFISKYKFELLMEIKEKGEVVRVYTSGNDKTVTHFVMTATENDAFTLICLDGTMSREDLERLVAKTTKEMD